MAATVPCPAQYPVRLPAARYAWHPAPIPPPIPTPAPPIAGAVDPFGFTAWINATRVAYRLPPVAYDANLSAWASANNAQQVVRGLGHYVMGTARRQDAAWAPGFDAIRVAGLWMDSPGHRAAILDPTATTFGIAQSGPYWTLNLR